MIDFPFNLDTPKRGAKKREIYPNLDLRRSSSNVKQAREINSWNADDGYVLPRFGTVWPHL